MSALYKIAGILLLALVAGIVLTVPSKWFDGDRSIDNPVPTAGDTAKVVPDTGNQAPAVSPPAVPKQQTRPPQVGGRAPQQVAVPADGSRDARSTMSIVVEDGRISVSFLDRPLWEVMEKIGLEARIVINFDHGVGYEHVSAEFADLTLIEGLERILDAYDAFFYRRGDRGLQLVWVYPKGVGSRFQPVPPDQWASTKEIAQGLTDPDPKQRAESLRLYVERMGRKARAEVLQGLSDDDAWVRTLALEGALYEGIKLAPEMLSRLATTDPAEEVRFLALQGLSNHPDAELLAQQAVDDPSPHVRAYAEQFLTRLEQSRNPPKRQRIPQNQLEQ